MVRIIRFIFTSLHIAIFIAMAAIFLNYIIPPEFFVWLNFTPIAFPILIILYSALTIVWILNLRKRAILFMAGFFLFINPIKRWVNYASNTYEGNLKILTYNINTGKEISKLKSFIEIENPDVIFFQEKPETLKKELNSLGFKYSIERNVVGIYSKYPIETFSEIIQKKQKNNGHALYADIKIKEKTIRFINVYLEPFYLEKNMLIPEYNSKINKEKVEKLGMKLSDNFVIHQKQVNEIQNIIENSPYPIILGGDLNAVPNSYEYYTFSRILSDAFVESGRGFSTSFHDYKFPIRIDYIFSSSDLKATKYTIKRDMKISDHFPIISHFDIK